MARWKKVTLWVLGFFAFYAVVTAPNRAAYTVQSAFQGVAAAAQSVTRFFDALMA